MSNATLYPNRASLSCCSAAGKIGAASLFLALLVLTPLSASHGGSCQWSPAEPMPDVRALVRAGQWLHGANFPWDHYGIDFGANAWGYRGLANQGPQGWRIETRSPNGAAQGLSLAPRNGDDRALKVRVAFDADQPTALVNVRFDEPASREPEQTVDLEGATITADLYFPSGIQGPSQALSGFMFYVQSLPGWTWAQSNWTNISTVDQWITVSTPPVGFRSWWLQDSHRTRDQGRCQ